MTFGKIYFISDHAVSAFKTRLNCQELSTKQTRDYILSELQKENLAFYERYNHRIQPVYQGEYNGSVFFIPVHKEVKKTDAWDVVPTILLPGMKTYSKNLEMLSVEEAAKKLEVSQEQVIQFLKDGRLKFDPRVKHVIKIYKLEVRRLNQELLKERSIC
ncbi:MAG: hypothetical protein PHX86_08660 [Caldisericia bacterium]|nr:hypothetical protein [Caldisericia bacterium]